jgi:hypothetical protein
MGPCHRFDPGQTVEIVLAIATPAAPTSLL